jgi:putative serine protease PepD
MSRSVGAEEGFDDDGPEFRAPLPPEDRVWRHPAEMGAAAAVAAANQRSGGRSPWAVGFVSVIGGVLLASSLMFGAGGVGEDRGRIALRPIATVAPREDGDSTKKIAALDAPTAPRSLVGIDVSTGSEARSGNGLLVQAPGYVVTTAGLVADATDIRVTDDDGVVHTGSRVVGVDPLNDLAVLQVEGLVMPVAVLERAAAAGVGQEVYVVGATRGVGTPTRAATVESIDARLTAGNVDLHGIVQLDISVDVTSAGAPLMTSGGRILGLVTTRLADEQALAIPTRTVAWVAQQLITSGAVQHGWLGVEGVNAEPSPPDDVVGIPDVVTAEGGALVHRVVDASPAQAAGLQADDVVVAVDGEAVTRMSSLVVAVREHAPGSTVTVSIVRDDARQDVQVALGDTPPL